MTLRLFLLLVIAGCGGGSGGGTAADAAPDAVVLPQPVGRFPAGFLWGTAMAPYQVEKGLAATDWHQWETLCGFSCSGDKADDGPDFLAHYDADFALAQGLGNNTIRIGIEWARIFPTRASFPGQPDAAAVATYHAVLASAKAHGLNPMVTLHHFSTPTWVVDLTKKDVKQGWEIKETADLFGEWSKYCAREFGGEVDWWITLNEPMAYVLAGWIGGVFPPGKLGDRDAGLDAVANLIRAHVIAYDAIHAEDLVDADGDGKAAWVSIATHNRVFVPRLSTDAAAAESARKINNLFFTDALVKGDVDWNFDGDYDDSGEAKGDERLSGRLDYIGLNYYGVTVIADAGPGFAPFGLPFLNDLGRFGIPNAVTDFGTVVYPEGFRVVLNELVPYGLPILITENGLADAGDVQRPRFIAEHLYEMQRAIDEGVDIRGYYHWSLIDNFEWAAGYCPQFGLIHVDRASAAKTRTLGAGAQVYKEIIAAGTVPVELFRRYPSYPPASKECPRTGP